MSAIKTGSSVPSTVDEAAERAGVGEQGRPDVGVSVNHAAGLGVEEGDALVVEDRAVVQGEGAAGPGDGAAVLELPGVEEGGAVNPGDRRLGAGRDDGRAG